MISIEVVGKNVEQAITNGLAELRVTRDDVEIKIIEAGGLFKKAKVQIIVDKEVEERLNARDAKLKKLEEVIKEEINEQPKQEVTKEPKIVKEVTPYDDSKSSDGAKAARNFVLGVMEKTGIVGEVDAKNTEEGNIEINITGEDVGALIGYRGEALAGLQYLATIVAGKAEENINRVYVDVCDYKEKREQSLIKLARRMAVKVAKSRTEFKFEPMNAYERRIIHAALQSDSYVTTTSRGEEPRRYVVIELKKE